MRHHESATTVVDEPVVADGAHRETEGNTEVLTPEVHIWIRELVTIRRVDRPARDRCVGCPRAICVLFAFPANAALGMGRVRVILLEAWGTVMVVIVNVSDVRAAAVLDLEAVADMPGVIHRVEVVDAAISDAGTRACKQPERCQRHKEKGESPEKAFGVHGNHQVVSRPETHVIVW